MAKQQNRKNAQVETPVVETAPSTFVQIDQCEKVLHAGKHTYGEIPAGFAVGQKGKTFYWYMQEGDTWRVYTNGLGRQGFTSDPQTATLKTREWAARPGNVNRYDHRAMQAAARGMGQAAMAAAQAVQARTQAAVA